MFSWAAVFTFQITYKSKITCYIGSSPSSPDIIHADSKNALHQYTQRLLNQEMSNEKAFSDALSYVKNFKYEQNLTTAVTIHRHPKCAVWEYQCATCCGKNHITCTTCVGNGEVICDICNGRRKRTCTTCYGEGEVKCYYCYGGYNNCSHCSYGKIFCAHCSGSGIIKKFHHYDNVYVDEYCDYCNGTGTRNCYVCYGTAKIPCSVCSGHGKDRCLSCDGVGEVPCEKCSASGRLTCPLCKGDGIITCPHCMGKGILHEIGEAYTICSGQKKFHIPPQFTVFNENINTDEYVPRGIFANINSKQITKIFTNSTPKCMVYVCSPVDENKYYDIELIGENPIVIDYKNIFDVFIINKVDIFEDNCKNIQVLSKDFSKNMRKYFADFLAIPMAQDCLSKLPASDQEKRIMQITTQNIHKINCHFLLHALMVHIPLLTFTAIFFCNAGPIEKILREDVLVITRILFFLTIAFQSWIISVISGSLRSGYLKKINNSLFSWTEKKEWYVGKLFGGLILSGIIMGVLVLGLPQVQK